MKQSRLIS